MKVTLHIESAYDKRDVVVDNEISIGRSNASDIVLDDAGLSRKNTTFFVDEGELFVADENSLNGTILNGEKVTGGPRQLSNGDTINIGSNTTIEVSIGETARAMEKTGSSREDEPLRAPVPSIVPTGAPGSQRQNPRSAIQNPTAGTPPFLLIAAAALAVLILVLGAAALVIGVLVWLFWNKQRTKTA